MYCAIHKTSDLNHRIFLHKLLHKKKANMGGGGGEPQTWLYLSAGKSLPRPIPQCILFGGENIMFDASLVVYKNCTNIPPITIINRIFEHQNLLSL